MALGFVNMAILFPRFLGTSEFGLTRLVASIAIVAAQIAQFGGETTMIRYFPYFNDRSRRHGGLFGLMLVVATAGGVICMVVLGLFHAKFARWFNDTSGLYLKHGLIVLPLALAEVYFFVLRGISRSVRRSIAPVFARELLLRVFQMALIGSHILWDLSLSNFLLGYVATFALTTLILLYDLWRADELVLGLWSVRVPRRMARSMVRYSAFTFGSGLAAIAVGNIDQVMVGAMLKDGLDYVAFYAVATFMAGLIMVPARALIVPTVPLLADAWRKRDHALIESIYRRSASVQLVTAGYLLLCIWSCLDPLFSFLPEPYAIAKPALIVLGFTNMVSLSAGLSANIVSTSRSYWFDAVSGAVLLVLNISLDYVFILAFGFIGAAWSSFAAMVVVLFGRVLFLRKRFDLWPFDRNTLFALLVIAAVAVPVGFLPHAGPEVVDALWRCGLVTLLYWPAVHWLRIAPELSLQAKKIAAALFSVLLGK
jgi:O-antigen/teichoic acid export membrane protein